MQPEVPPARRESSIVLIALVGAGFGATAVFGSLLGALIGRQLGAARGGLVSGGLLGATAGVVIGVFVAGKVTGTARSRRRLWTAVAGGELGLVAAMLLAVYAEPVFRVFQVVLVLVPGICAAAADRWAATRR